MVGKYGAAAEVGAQLVSSNGTLSGSLLNVGSGLVWPPPWPGVAYGGGKYLEVWKNGNITSGVDMFGQQISPAGTLVGSSFPLLASVGSHGSQTILALASARGNFLVVWKDGATSYLYGQIVTNGSLSGPEFLISGQPQTHNWAAAASDGTNFLVVWQNADMIGDGLNSTYGSFVSSNGSVGSAFQIDETDSLDSYEPPAVMFDGANYLVVWNTDTMDDAHGNGLDLALYGRLVSPTGVMPGDEVVLEGQPGSTTYNDNSYPNLAFDGQNYLLVWTPSNADAITNVSALSGQFFDPSLNPLGQNFAALPATGTNRPTVALNGLIYDGTRFVLAGGYGLLTPNSAGDFGGITYWQTRGAFLSNSAAALPALEFGYETNTDGVTITITNYVGPGGAVTIPSDIDGLTVTGIGSNAFEGLASLTSVTIPGSITNLGENAFEYCEYLTSVVFEGNAPAADSSVFDDSPSVYYLPDTAGWTVFSASTGLQTYDEYDFTTNSGSITITGYNGPGGEVTIPSTITGRPVTAIGDNAFKLSFSMHPA